MQRVDSNSGKLEALVYSLALRVQKVEMFYPKVLINLAVLVAFVTTGLFVALIWTPPYTGFMLELDPDSNLMMVTRADDWIVRQGLDVGDKIVTISTPDGLTLDLEAKHVLTSTYQARRYYENREARLKELAKVHQIFERTKVQVRLNDGETINLTLDHPRSFSSISFGVWVRFFLSLAAPLIAAMVWVWQPQKKEAVFLLFSGMGLFFLTLPSAATIYEIDMYYPGAFVFWLLKFSGGIGDFMYIGFASCLLLYFPQKLKNADTWSTRLLIGLFIYALVTLFNDWQLGAPLTEQFLYYSYSETYLPMVVFYVIMLRLCFLQWQMSEHQPVERAQALWIILSWTLGPSIFVIFYLLPVALGAEGLLNRTMNTLVIASSFWMVLLGVARFKLFQIEQYIGAAYQWSFVSLLFFGLDILLVYSVNISPQISTFIIIALVLWCYLPLRQWFHQRISLDRQQKYQRLFNDAVVQMVEESMISTAQPRQSWQAVLDTVFSPVSVQKDNHKGKTLLDERGQRLSVEANRHSPTLRLEYAENGTRLFTTEYVELVGTLSLLFERLHEFRDAYFSGQTQERERIRRDLHDQVGHKLLSLIYTAKDDKSQRLAQETMEQLRELIQALKDEPVLILDSVVSLRHLSEDACEHAGLSLQWNDSIDRGETRITSNQHLNILNIFRELLNNTIRHANADRVSITVKNYENSLEITLADNGVGFDQASVTPGSGLHNIQSRVEELKAKIGWRTSSGTQVALTVPLTSAGEGSW